MSNILIIFLILSFLLALYFWEILRSKKSNSERLYTPPPCNRERALTIACSGNTQRVDELILIELKRSSRALTRSQAANAAYERLMRDKVQ
jgi:hypothetical protein